MDPVLYNSMNGSRVDFYRQQITANNMANINTTGFKADMFAAQSLYINGSVLSGEALAVQQQNGNDFSDGPLMTTGRDLDVAIQGNGWFAVNDSKGKEAYTRAGELHITENGMLVNASKQPVLGDGGPISIPPAQRVEIGTDGTISIVPLEGPPGEVAVIDRIKMVRLKPQEVVKGPDGLMKLAKGGIAPADANLVLVKGAIEGSNVNPVEQMVGIINTGQEFNTKMKIMGTADSNAQKLAQLLQL
ncbi:Putative proximal rod protein [Legionella massiliensis]|uniref:Flagellar basal-body rod protein FlgF n=1 Tax=Legionella massiliensis TaxID=1034943 RepID=A0A078KYI4_9GAMM|nr:flagellar basal body rod protein FlgF [Legionella massiliensis]CDZ78137.1 Putative proximal rod protein [Legionella massiliensis]CEE13875.1 Flagellar basal-body rod protein FlgF [Legionella massiliensis]